MSFVGLHIHSDYSLLDGASQLPQLVNRAVELGMPAIALTDHGVMYGAIELIKVCRNKNIKPIIGNEMYIINGDIEKQERRPRYHQVVLAKNTKGYKNLVKLTTISNLKGVQGKGIFSRPCINKDLLKEYHEGLMVTSACLGGEVPQAIMRGRLDAARKVAQWYKDVFGDDYYLEIQDHGSQEDRIVNVEIVKLARELDIKIVATNDSHFISCNDVEAHDALLCIQTGKQIIEDNRLRYSGTEYLKSADEMRQLFRDHLPDEVIEEAITNTLEVAAKVEPYHVMGEPRLPNYPIPAGSTPDTYVEEKAWEGLLERLNAKSRAEIKPGYKERLEYELKMIQQMGFSTYFLVVWDYIKFARDKNIPVGPGRGSAAGSLVAYALRITNIDPVHHGLLFERFLNPERKSMPDIDTDFCIDRRDEVIEYVTQKYGADRVAQIITFNRMTSKAVLKDVARVLGIPYGEADKMAKLIPVSRGKPEKLSVMISDKTPAPEFKQAYDSREEVRRWLDMAIRIEGTNKTFGVHAAGVVISADPLDEIVPLQKNNDGSVITQYFMEDLESVGLLKMDFLGLRNLTMLQKAVDLIKQSRNIEFDPDQIPLEERKVQHILAKGEIKKIPETIKKTYKVLADGELEGIFQLESSGMRQVVQKLKPSNLEDISSILALYRPGPLDSGLVDQFIDRKHGREKVEYKHPLLEPILQETYGTLCLPKGTLINKLAGSHVPIEEIQAGDTILTSDGQKIWPARVAKQWGSGIKEILKLSLSSGTVIYTSKTHRFLTPEGDKVASELKPAVGGLKNAHIYSSVLYEQWPTSKHSQKLRQNEAYLLGLFIGDGNLVSPTPNIACSQEETAAWVANLISETWGGEPKYYFHTRCWYAYSKFKTQPKPTPLTQFMDAIYGGRDWKVKSIKKHLPEDILDYCEQDRIDLLRGLWDSDGCYSQNLLYFRSSSPKLIQQVGCLLGTLKIAYSVGDNYVYIADRNRFKSILGKAKLPGKQIYEIQPGYLPISSDVFAEALAESISQTDRVTRSTVKRSLQRATLFKPRQSGYQKKLEDWDDLYHQIYQETYLQDARPVYVLSVDEVGEAECFDLQMADQTSPYFLAYGVVTHNCYQEQIMKLAQDLAGYSLGQADLLRRAMGKKKLSEMEKQRENFIDGATKNGVSKKIAEELFGQMVNFAEYCFNKSHSTAYAYVTYQTAYLKANYPVEYMAALLTANSGDQDKVKKYITNCQNMGIEVEGPNVNRSGVEFTPAEGKILFGLSAVKNLGEGAIASIIQSREKDGSFKSLADLCDRVNLHAVNGRALEALIHCGAFDTLESNRNQLIHDLPLVIDWAKSRAKDREIGQGNLFDLLGGGNAFGQDSGKEGFKSAPKAPAVPDFPSQEKLQKEKELLGFYISAHPLKTVGKIAQVLALTPINLGQLGEMKAKANISTIVQLAEVKQVITKKGDPMAILQIEDLTGQAEAVVFPKIYENISSLLEANATLILWGKVDKRDDQTQLIVEDAEPIEAVQTVMVELRPQQVNPQELSRLQNILQEQRTKAEKARVPVIAVISGQHRRELRRLDPKDWVQDPVAAVNTLKNLGYEAYTRSMVNG